MTDSSKLPGRAIAPRIKALAGAVALAAPLFAAGCETFAPGQGNSAVQRDIYDIKTKLDKSIEDQASSDRQLKYSLNSIDQNLQGRNDQTKAAIDDLNKQLRTQSDTIDRLTKQVESLVFTVDGLNKRQAMAGGAPDLAAGSAASPIIPSGSGLSAPSGAAPAPAAGAGLAQTLANGQNMFNLQNYAGARDAFTAALAQNPQGDDRVEALYWLAESYNKLGDTPNAQKYYKDVITSNARHEKAWKSLEQLGNIILAQGDRDTAFKLLNQIVEASTRTPPYIYPDLERVKATIAQIQQGAAAAPAPTATPASGPAPAIPPSPAK